ncbi:MAG: polysaccharide deacetylase family protein [Clostridiales bacterium]|jgi:peptidoglycan/xylan/chitin deacetylase (PgdA/CDA1 family)|nr:polysaccharide deacetylase family protein [Clostridiales bacterium]
MKLKIKLTHFFIWAILCAASFNLLLRDPFKSIFLGHELPIMAYHNFVDNSKATDTMNTSVEQFHKDLESIKRQGYTSIFLSDLIAFCEKGADLPDKPILITFDDGYISNYNLAFPILKEFKMKATIFIVGCNVGRKTDVITGEKLIEHFSDSQAKEMLNSGLIDIQLHTFNLHRPNFNMVSIRDLMTKDRYAAYIRNDTWALAAYISRIGGNANSLAYPYGFYNSQTEKILKDSGIKATLTSDRGINYIYKNKKSLYGLKRLFPIK